MIKNISNLGDAAIYCDFGEEVNEEVNSNVIGYFDHLKFLVDQKKIFHNSKLDNPTLIKPGDKVSFCQITKKEYLKEKAND